ANRANEDATVHLLPHLWFRNTWWREPPPTPRPVLERTAAGGRPVVTAVHSELGTYALYVDRDAPLLFTENETNEARVFGSPRTAAFVKDGINDCVVAGRDDAVNDTKGTKAAAWLRLSIPAGASTVARLRLVAGASEPADPFAGFDAIVEERRRD